MHCFLADVIAKWQMEKSLQGGCVLADVIASDRWKNHKVNYFNFSSEVLNRTSSQTCGRWYLTTFLLEDGSLTLMYRASFILLHQVHLLSLLESWALSSSLTTFKLAWKTATVLALVTAKCCSDLSLLCIDNQHHFLQYHAAIFIPVCGGKMDPLGHLPPWIHIESHSNVNFALFFI